MRLDPGHLQVETFATAAPGDIAEPIWMGEGGQEPDGYISDPAGNTDPECEQKETVWHPCPLPDTYVDPCTQPHQ